MRVIKIRAWHEAQKKMYSPEIMGSDQLTIMPDGQGFINVSGDDTRRSEFIRTMIPLQYTGLNDKNGKEIYEGDILNFPEKSKFYQTYPNTGINLKVKVDNSNWWGIVEYLNDEVGIGTIGRFAVKGLMWKPEYCEVIGNIYENPELLGE